MMLAATILFLSGAALAKGPAACKEASLGLTSQAKVTCAQAQKKALKKVPQAKVESRELEEENGKLVYSFDLKRKGRSRIEEVQVDARTGAVISMRHESPVSEATEQRNEKSQH